MSGYAARVLGFVREVAGELEGKHVFLLASGIAFNTILFLLPTAMVMILVVGSLVDTETIVESLMRLVDIALPRLGSQRAVITNALLTELRSLGESVLSIGWIGIPGLLWTGTTLFASFRTGLNAVFGHEEAGFFLKYKMQELWLLLVFTLLLIAVSAATTVVAFVQSQLVLYVFDGQPVLGLVSLVSRAVSAVSSMILFFFLYVTLPEKRPAWRLSAGAALLATVLWEGSKVAYAWYVSDVASYSKIYGTWTVLFVTALWLFYTAFIFLFSGVVARLWFVRRHSQHQHESIRHE